jgi:hypothetical protein
MLFTYDKPKSQAYRIARFEAIQYLKKTQKSSLNSNMIDNFTQKIYNNETEYSGPENSMNMMITNTNIKQSLIFEPTPSPINSNYPINQEQQKKILVLFVYHIFNNRVKNFIENCIFYDENIDFIIISNNKNNNDVINVKNVKNVKMLFRNNVGYDFGGWSDALLTENLYKKYDNFIFVNSSITGPFLKPGFKGNWTDIYINGLKDNVKLFGSTINTIRDPLKFAHVQSYIFSMNKTTLEYLINCKIFSTSNYAKTFQNAIFDKEVLMSRKIIENNWNIGSLMKYYKNVDFTFRNKKPNEYNINFLDDVMFGKYRNKIWNEFELVFIKGNRMYNPK